MFFLVLWKLFLWNMCWYIAVVDAEPGDHSLKREEYQLGIKQCEERCLDTGECLGFNYDSSALRCSLAFGEDNFRHKLDSFPKLDLKDLGSIKTQRHFYGCDVTRVYKPMIRDYLFILGLNQLTAIHMESLNENYTWPFEKRNNIKLSGLTNSYIKTSPSRNESFIFIIVSSTENEKMCLLSIKHTKLFTMDTIDLKDSGSLRSMMAGTPLALYVDKLCLISRCPGHHHELSIAKLVLMAEEGNTLEQFSSLSTGAVRVTDNPIDFFVHDNYVFVLFKNVLLRWTMGHTGISEMRNDSMRMYRWDSPRNTVCLSVHQGETLYIVDKDNHLRKLEMHLLLKELKILDD